jgi:hypothetical protein
MHLLEGLPLEWVVRRDASGRVVAAKASLTVGFLKSGRFYIAYVSVDDERSTLHAGARRAAPHVVNLADRLSRSCPAALARDFHHRECTAGPYADDSSMVRSTTVREAEVHAP